MTITKGDHIPVDDQFDILGITESLGRADMAKSTPEFRSSSIWAIVPRGAYEPHVKRLYQLLENGSQE